MTVNSALELQGFLKFITRAGNELQKWFGTYCNNDSARIAFMASREWDGMSDLERKPFIRSSNNSGTLNVNPYVRYLLHQRYSGVSENVASNQIFDPKSAKLHGNNWKSLSEEQRQQFSTMKTNDSGIQHVIEKRNKLHQLYEPKKLCLLEFILKTKPRWPTSSRLWFFRAECLSLASLDAKEKWLNMTAEERAIYERCALLDRKRFEFEKNAWITRMIGIDFEADLFTLKDFEVPNAKSRIDWLSSIVDISKDLPASVELKRPRNAFSLFIEAYRYQIRDKRPRFEFGRHLKECSEAWSRLSDEEKEFYINQSRELKKKRKELLANEPLADSRLTIPIDIFNASKSVHGPCKPAHLIQKLPNLITYWANENSIKAGHRQEQWNALPESEKQTYIDKHEKLKKDISRQKSTINTKVKYIKQLVREARVLEDLKRKLHLIGSSNRPVKNLYT